mmetsp:Transcript_40201/g.106114  ORF Transcript_40201/g.106114 Transcript_40201/m.106114 type:complete len:228 (-) Transcript_40201:2081-2764(-)
MMRLGLSLHSARQPPPTHAAEVEGAIAGKLHLRVGMAASRKKDQVKTWGVRACSGWGISWLRWQLLEKQPAMDGLMSINFSNSAKVTRPPVDFPLVPNISIILLHKSFGMSLSQKLTSSATLLRSSSVMQPSSATLLKSASVRQPSVLPLGRNSRKVFMMRDSTQTWNSLKSNSPFPSRSYCSTARRCELNPSGNTRPKAWIVTQSSSLSTLPLPSASKSENTVCNV